MEQLKCNHFKADTSVCVIINHLQVNQFETKEVNKKLFFL